MTEKKSTIWAELSNHLQILGSFVALIWFIEILDTFVFRRSLDQFGIIPHNIIGLRGILFAPFLHGSFTHVAANTMPFLVLGWFIMLRGVNQFFVVSFWAALIGGLGTWFVGNPNSVHVGASGVIFGYLGFLIFKGYFERSFVAVILSFLAAFLYGGVLWGILPIQHGISWEGHLFGFIGGIIAARLLTPSSPPPFESN
ncbi:putative membrane protein [Synechococcus sp. PCC 7502]|uniref:rhomboid family intramembrane serine protease n=1 Tax=Synechococcus sp. PCC 7502 TaxID=1173263 RepID=UPI0002A0009D|nr:rhomboid family intramembrane serine protease [Synechococcus sp. PCC 7502]AFY73085.1 putative membrane protein [Synechococcus sp. PCC 7502]